MLRVSVLGACCVRARVRSSGETVSRLSSGLTNDGVNDQYFLDYNFYTYSCFQLWTVILIEQTHVVQEYITTKTEGILP